MNYCFCVSGGCKEHPKGFRVLSTRKYREHQKAEALFLITDLHAHVDTGQSLDDIRKRLMRYKEEDLQSSAVTFQTKVDAAQSVTSLQSVLIPHDTANHGLLGYEKWHKESIELLKTIPGSAIRHVQAMSLVEELLGFNSQTLAKIEVELKSRSRPGNEVQGDSTHAASLLDSTIVNHVRSYRRLHPLPTPAGDILGGQSLPHNLHHTSTQLIWIDNMIKEIHDQKAISPLRRTELLDGLEEHRGNIKNELGREVLHRRYPHLPVRAIIKSTFSILLSE